MSLKRVLLSINVRWWNAEAAYAINLARGLEQQGLNVWLILNQDSPAHQKALHYGLRVVTDIQLDAKSPLVHLRNLRNLLRFVDNHGIQLINSFKSNGSFIFSIARKLRPGLLYLKTRGIAIPPKNHLFNRYLYGKSSCDGVICVGSPVRKWIDALLGKSTSQLIETIHYGDAPTGIKTDRPQEFSPPDKPIVFALLGRTQHVKGHSYLVNALHELRNHKLQLLFLVKDLEEYPETLEEIQHFLKTHALEDRVTILGFQEKLADVLAQVDCGVIPSLSSEVNCRVCVEFFSCGIPAIVFPTGSLPDIVNHRVNGYLCREKTVQELVMGMRWVIEEPEAFAKAKAQAFQDYLTNYTLETMAIKTIRFYHKCKTT